MPYINNDRIDVKYDVLEKYQTQYPILGQMRLKQDIFKSRVLSSQWVTRYFIVAQNCRCSIIQNQFNYDMYFQRSNNGDKDVLLPFLKIVKNLVMQGKVKHLNIIAPAKVYNLINKCFLFNLADDDNCDRYFNTNHEYQHFMPPSELIYVLNLNELSVVIPEISQTVIVIQNC